MLKIVKKFPAVRAFGTTALWPGEALHSADFELDPRATHVAAAGSCFDASGCVRVGLTSGTREDKVTSPLMDLPSPGVATTGLRPIAGRHVRVVLEAFAAGRIRVGPVDLYPAAVEDVPEGADGEEAVAR